MDSPDCVIGQLYELPESTAGGKLVKPGGWLPTVLPKVLFAELFDFIN